MWLLLILDLFIFLVLLQLYSRTALVRLIVKQEKVCSSFRNMLTPLTQEIDGNMQPKTHHFHLAPEIVALSHMGVNGVIVRLPFKINSGFS